MVKVSEVLALYGRTTGNLSHQLGETSVGKSSRYPKDSNGNKQRDNKELPEKKAVSLKWRAVVITAKIAGHV